MQLTRDRRFIVPFFAVSAGLAIGCTPLDTGIGLQGDAGDASSPPCVVPEASDDANTASSDGRVPPDAVLSSVVWGEDIVDSARGLYPAVAVGPAVDGGSWMIQIASRYADPANDLDSQIGRVGQGLGPIATVTQGNAPPSITALGESGDVFAVYEGGGNLWFFQGFPNPDQTAISWPDGIFISYGHDGFRPSVAATALTTDLGPTIVVVDMVDHDAGVLEFNVDGLNGWAGFSDYDQGPSQNPAVAAAAASGGSASVVEVHQDPSNNLSYRMATVALAPGQLVTWWNSTPLAGEQGQRPAVAICGSTVLEVHEGPAGDLRYMLGALGPSAFPSTSGAVDVTWKGPSQAYEDAGADPAIAIDPTTCQGVEVHDSIARDGTMTAKPFVLR